MHGRGWRGSYGYLTAWAGEGNDDDAQIPLCRIEYLGGDDGGFAIYDSATAFDTAAITHLAEYQQ